MPSRAEVIRAGRSITGMPSKGATMAAKTVAEKLQVKPGTTVWSSQPEYIRLIGALPEGAALAGSMADATVAIVFVASEAIARETLGHLRDHLAAPSILWVAYPKGNRADINRDTLWPILGEYGLRPVSQVAIDDTWSALRFRPLEPGEEPFNPGGANTTEG
jgi:hypothetical protein